jgi:DNA-binding LytR/AlgR family response regulator
MIVEDEPIAVDIVKSYIEHVNFLSLDAVCNNAIAALDILKDAKIDLIFLDIHLPGLKGIEFLKLLTNPPKVIIMSAYEQYAIESFELETVDYLLKPFSLPRFLKAVNRLKPLLAQAFESSVDKKRYLFFNVNKKMIKVHLDEILYIESRKEYVKIFTGEKHILVKFQIGELERILDGENFLRVHRSFIVAKAMIDSFSALAIEIRGVQIPIGRSYLEEVKRQIHT